MIHQNAAHTHRRFLAWLLLLLLTAVALRLFALTNFPPGLTHDEAAHGLTAQAILQGKHALYFSIGHGREPLYDYATALLMAAIGPTYLAGRLTAVYSSLLLIAATAAWVRRAFGWQTAVLTAAGLALSFWPLMSARQSLRSILLPLLFTLAIYFFWQGLTAHPRRWLSFTLAGLFCGLTVYTYIPARIIWLLFPATACYTAWLSRRSANSPRPFLPGLLLMVGLTAVMVLPLVLFLAANPEAEIRIRELSSPLTAVAQGDLAPLWHNIRSGLGIIAWQGDDFWRYNLPGRPLLSPIMALFWLIGLVLAAYWLLYRPQQRPQRAIAAWLATLWLLLGISPNLVTGAHLSSTQAIAIQPVLYLFPAIALHAIRQQLGPRWVRPSLWLMLLLFGATAVATSHTYFVRWGQAPEVRVQYESAMVAIIQALAQQPEAEAAIATITPNPLHSPAVAQLMAPQTSPNWRWFDGRHSLLIPHSPTALLVTSGFASVPPVLRPFLPNNSPLPILQPATDFDQPLLQYPVNSDQWLATHLPQMVARSVQFGQAVQLLGYQLSATAVDPTQPLHILTLWQVQQAQPDLRLFSHIVNQAGQPIAQADLLSAPSDLWQTGDYLLQHHEISLPSDLFEGQYGLTIGWYVCLDSACQQTERLPVWEAGTPIGDNLYVQPISLSK